MIDYGPNAKRNFFKSGNQLYTRIADEKGNVCFVELYSMKDFPEFRKTCRESCDTLLNIHSISQNELPGILDFVLDLNVEMLKLQETVEVIKKSNDNPLISNVLTRDILKISEDINNLTHSLTQTAKNYPQEQYNYRFDLFKIPGVVEKIIEGQEKFEDVYGTIEDSNHKAYKSLIVRDMLAGKDVFSVEELTRLDHHSATKNAKLEQEYSTRAIR